MCELKIYTLSRKIPIKLNYIGDQTEIGILNLNVISRIITTARPWISGRRHKLTLARMRFVSSALFSHNKRLQRGDICVVSDKG